MDLAALQNCNDAVVDAVVDAVDDAATVSGTAAFVVAAGISAVSGAAAKTVAANLARKDMGPPPRKVSDPLFGSCLSGRAGGCSCSLGIGYRVPAGTPEAKVLALKLTEC
jgi:hypothetical protein